jgi:hypothetical protein
MGQETESRLEKSVFIKPGFVRKIFCFREYGIDKYNEWMISVDFSICMSATVSVIVMTR